jgi:antitoxin YefM
VSAIGSCGLDRPCPRTEVGETRFAPAAVLRGRPFRIPPSRGKQGACFPCTSDSQRPPNLTAASDDLHASGAREAALSLAPAKRAQGDHTRIAPGRLHGGVFAIPPTPRSSVTASNKPVYTSVYHVSMAKTVPVREFRRNLSRLLSDVADRRDHVLVSRHGRPAAALVPVDEYEALEETAEILSDPDALAALEAGLAELERGETVSLEDLRRELDEHRPRG